MKSRLLLTAGLMGLFLFSCQELELQPNFRKDASFNVNGIAKSNPTSRTSENGVMDVIDFEHYKKGEIISEVFSKQGAGPVKVWGHNPDFPGQNAAMIFDSSTPQGGTVDLGTPNEDFGGPGIGSGGERGSAYQNKTALGNLLIVTADFNSSKPRDAKAKGSMLTFDFSSLADVSVHSLVIIDMEENDATVTFFDGAGQQIGNTFSLPDVGNNGVHDFKFGGGVSGVAKMVVLVNGTAAIDNVGFRSKPNRQKGNNGWGNGEDPAPGNSLENQPKFEDPDTGPTPCNSPECADGDR